MNERPHWSELRAEFEKHISEVRNFVLHFIKGYYILQGSFANVANAARTAS